MNRSTTFETSNTSKEKKNDTSKVLLERFSMDLTVVLKDSVEKVVERVRKEYKK